MKANRKLLGAMVALGVLVGSAGVFAQGKGHAYRHTKHHNKKHDQYARYDRHDHDHYSSRYAGRTYDHHHHDYHRPPHWAPAYGYRTDVRYVYYRDYDVYFDCYRGVYITFTGRNWIYSQHVPVHMRRINFNHIAFVELDYFDDNLPHYLERRRSGGYVSIHARF